MKHVVLVGLGNPGREYETTRHNLGYLVVQALAHELNLQFKKESKFESFVATGTYDGVKVELVLPLTFMNESGRAVGKILAFYKLSMKELIIAVDDMALPFGHMRIRALGSAGGHNGLKSIEAVLGTKHYLRLRLGIDVTVPHMSTVDYVLGHFTSKERKELQEYISKAVDCLKRLLKEDYHKVASDVNRKLTPEEGIGEKE
jgi:peptidyl-tRNA hydrolase, PTH1 family